MLSVLLILISGMSTGDVGAAAGAAAVGRPLSAIFERPGLDATAGLWPSPLAFFLTTA